MSPTASAAARDRHAARARHAARVLCDDLARRLTDLDLDDVRYDRLLALQEKAYQLLCTCEAGAGLPAFFWSTFAVLAGELAAIDAGAEDRRTALGAARALASALRDRIAAAAVPTMIHGQLTLLLTLLDEGIDKHEHGRLATPDFHVIVARARAAVEDALFTVARAA